MRYYSSVAQATTLTAGVTAGETSIQVASTTGFPSSHPFTLVLSPGTAEEEIVTVTASAGTTLSVTRGEDGTTAMSHSAGAEVRHMVTARDLREAQEHINATNNVHGASGTLVTTSATQTLTNKTIDGGNNNLVNIPSSAISGLSTFGSRVALNSTSISGQGILLGPFDISEFPGAETDGLACVIHAAGTASGVSGFKFQLRSNGGGLVTDGAELPVPANGPFIASSIISLSAIPSVNVDVYLKMAGGTADFTGIGGIVTALFFPGATRL